MRELQEEVGMLPTAALQDLLVSAIEAPDLKFIYSEATPVDCVHLGIWLLLDIDPDMILQVAEREVMDAVWLHRDDLVVKDLETWSSVLLPCL
jgi:predicted NUDIX family phosphoesterase